MKRIILIGDVGCGKTSLTQALMGNEIQYKKTQAVEVVDNIIFDTPGEYLERTQMRGALMITSADAEIIGLVQAASENRDMFPPCYAGAFAKEVIGIVTKIDEADEKRIKIAEEWLRMAGAHKVFKTSSLRGDGIRELADYLE